MRDGSDPNDRQAVEHYMQIQDFLYPIINEYADGGRYEFFIMLAAEMMHSAINYGLKNGMLPSEIYAEFEQEVDRHKQLQVDIQKIDKILKGFK